jgi:pimeloyl-ACP methyl ester carboxylesterase
VLSVLLALGYTACERSTGLPKPAPSSTPTSFDPFTRTAPEFEALPNATSHYGELDGGVFQIEVPDRWNGDLVVYFAGGQRFSRELYADDPPLRTYFVSEGYAWATTSYNTNLELSGDEARQSALLWDYFAQKFGRPGRTFAVGDSAGGDGVLVAVERYADRFDGALVGCGVAGVIPGYDLSADLLAAGAYAVGMTQAEFEAGPLAEVVHTQIEEVIRNNEPIRRTFFAIWEELSGGERPLFEEGYDLRPDIWLLAIDNSRLRLSDNVGRVYELGDADVDEADFNDRAIRFSRDPARSADPGDPTGEIRAPVILLHTTGDGIAPLAYAKLNAERIHKQGKGELLRVRVFARAAHCEFTYEDGTDAFEALVRWVTQEEEPPMRYQADFPQF